VWIDKRLPTMRRHPWYGVLASVGFIATAVVLKLIFPQLPPFLPLYPVVLLSAFVGGRRGGILAWVVCTALAAYYFKTSGNDSYPGIWGNLAVLGFAAVCALIVFIVDLLDNAVQRLQHERNRLKLALEAANLATWELHADGKLHWDESFFRMLGLDPAKDPPATERFLAMVHPDDRARMLEARNLMNQGTRPAPRDEYRITRPDGQVIWLENYRAEVKDGSRHFIGITQNITNRKRDERRIKSLMRELAHRVKNQYAVILAMVRETGKQAAGPAEFERLVQERIAALSRSHDLVIHGEWESADLRELLIAHVEAFGLSDRLDVSGPVVSLTATAAQYLGMAFHELCTNAAKHGAFSQPQGRVGVDWSIASFDFEPVFTLAWRESGGPKTEEPDAHGFGWKVLQRLTPAAISGHAKTAFTPLGLTWTIEAPARQVVSREGAALE
jgi:PAS domain S-box-containing protein